MSSYVHGLPLEMPVAADATPVLQSPEAAMPAPATAPDHYLAALTKMLEKKPSQGQQQAAPAAHSSNPYAMNNADNPYMVQQGAGGNPLGALAQVIKDRTTPVGPT